MYRDGDEAMLGQIAERFLLFRFRKGHQAGDLIRPHALGIVCIEFFKNKAKRRIIQHFRLL